MTKIDFYTHVADRYGVACQLVAKAYSRGQKVVVFTAGPSETAAFDEKLWSFVQQGFIPHCRASAALADETPVIVDHQSDKLPHHEVLINLHPEWPPFFSRFERLVEVISTDDDVAAAARGRFRYYRDCGYEIQSHNLSHLADKS